LIDSSAEFDPTRSNSPVIHFHELFVQFRGWSIHLLQKDLQPVGMISPPEQNQPEKKNPSWQNQAAYKKNWIYAIQKGDFGAQTSLDDMSGSHEKFTLISPRTSPVLEGLLPPKKTATLTE